MRPVTPRGFRDVLPAEASEREAIERVLGEVFSAWGYGLVETPVVERLDALEAAAGPLQGTAFRLLDLDGQLLALRPDVTVPIARLVASRMAGDPGPHRFRYAADVFREHESLRGQSRQFTQVGVELVGASGSAADAEVVAVLVEALRASGLERFNVALGTVAVLPGDRRRFRGVRRVEGGGLLGSARPQRRRARPAGRGARGRGVGCGSVAFGAPHPRWARGDRGVPSRERRVRL